MSRPELPPSGARFPEKTERKAWSRGRRRAWIVTSVAFALFAGHAALFGAWVVDDAGISYAYARNLAEGHGWVAQPGQPPVEGFSNALWVVLLASAHSVGWFDPVWTPKVLSGLLVFAAFFLLAGSWLDEERSSVSAVLALASAAAATPFVVWSVSGLENALSACLVGALTAASLAPVRRNRWGLRRAVALGCLCFLLFSTRPDGIVFLGVPPLLMGWTLNASRRETWAFAGSFLVPWVLYTGFRLLYFGDVLPNTYYAKRGPGWRETAWLLDALGVLAGGLVFILFVGLLGIAGILLAERLGRKLQRLIDPVPPTLRVFSAYFVTAFAAFELLPTDWMPEFRFGTALFLLGPWLVLEILRMWRHAAAPVGVGVLLLVSGLYSVRHTQAFRQQPTVPFEDVRRLSAELDRFAERVGVDRATVLLPDIGGSLWEDRFDVVDLAGLTDRTLGRTLHSDRDAFLDYVLERDPHLIWVHGYWRDLTGFEGAVEIQERYTARSPRSTLGRQDGVLYVRSSLVEGAGTRGGSKVSRR